MGQENNAKHCQLDKQTGETMKDAIAGLLAEYSEFNVETDRLTFTAENWTKFAEAIVEKVEEPTPEIIEPVEEEVVEDWENLKVDLELEVERLQKELDEFIESGWEANGNKLYFKGEEQY